MLEGRAVNGSVSDQELCFRAWRRGKRPIVSFDLVESRRSAGPAAVYVPDDIHSFADAIEGLLADPVHRLKLGELGYRRVQDELSWSRSEEALLEAYARLG